MKLAGTMKKLTVDQFRGTTTVSLREYYLKDGADELPGKKGINLNAAQWATLYSNIDALHQTFCNM